MNSFSLTQSAGFQFGISMPLCNSLLRLYKLWLSFLREWLSEFHFAWHVNKLSFFLSLGCGVFVLLFDSCLKLGSLGLFSIWTHSPGDLIHFHSFKYHLYTNVTRFVSLGATEQQNMYPTASLKFPIYCQMSILQLTHAKWTLNVPPPKARGFPISESDDKTLLVAWAKTKEESWTFFSPNLHLINKYWQFYLNSASFLPSLVTSPPDHGCKFPGGLSASTTVHFQMPSTRQLDWLVNPEVAVTCLAMA